MLLGGFCLVLYFGYESGNSVRLTLQFLQAIVGVEQRRKDWNIVSTYIMMNSSLLVFFLKYNYSFTMTM